MPPSRKMEECEQEHNSRMKNKLSEIKLGLSFIVTDPVYKYQMIWEVSFNYGTLMDIWTWVKLNVPDT
jgi:hypothetical protein